MAQPDVIVKYARGGQLLTKKLLGRDKIPSREALGLWKVDNNKAWKVYRTRNQFNKLSEDYLRADTVAALPMGNPFFITAKIQVGTAAPTDGFVLGTDWMDGTSFLKGNVRPFSGALQAQNIPRNAQDEIYIRYETRFVIILADSISTSG